MNDSVIVGKITLKEKSQSSVIGGNSDRLEKMMEKLIKVNQDLIKTLSVSKTKDNGNQNISNKANSLKTIGLLGIIAYQMKKSSPYLQGILSIFNRAMMIFFRPFGDALANFLKPMAIAMLKMAVRFLEWSKTPLGKVVSTAGGGAVAGAAAGAAIGSVIPGLGTAVGALSGGAIGALITLIPLAMDGLTDIFNLIKDSNMIVINAIKDKVTSLGTDLITKFKDLASSIYTSISDAITSFVQKLYDKLTGNDNKRSSSSSSSGPTSTYKPLTGSSSKTTTGSSSSSSSSYVSPIKKPTSTPVASGSKDIRDYFITKPTLPKIGSIGDGIVTPRGMIQTDPNDFIIATKDPKKLGVNGSNFSVKNYFNVPAYSLSEVDRQVRTSARSLEFSVRRRNLI